MRVTARAVAHRHEAADAERGAQAPRDRRAALHEVSREIGVAFGARAQAGLGAKPAAAKRQADECAPFDVDRARAERAAIVEEILVVQTQHLEVVRVGGRGHGERERDHGDVKDAHFRADFAVAETGVADVYNVVVVDDRRVVGARARALEPRVARAPADLREQIDALGHARFAVEPRGVLAHAAARDAAGEPFAEERRVVEGARLAARVEALVGEERRGAELGVAVPAPLRPRARVRDRRGERGEQ